MCREHSRRLSGRAGTLFQGLLTTLVSSVGSGTPRPRPPGPSVLPAVPAVPASVWGELARPPPQAAANSTPGRPFIPRPERLAHHLLQPLRPMAPKWGAGGSPCVSCSSQQVPLLVSLPPTSSG